MQIDAPEIQLYLTGQKPRDGLVFGVTHPASWGVHQIDGLREAGRLAGIEIDAFIPEPVAAAYRLIEEKQHRIKQNDLIGIIDKGGGTTDCTVLQWKQGTLHPWWVQQVMACLAATILPEKYPGTSDSF